MEKEGDGEERLPSWYHGFEMENERPGEIN